MTREKLLEELNKILLYIREAELTDCEFESIVNDFDLTLDELDYLQVFTSIVRVFIRRGNPDVAIEKLKCYCYIKLGSYEGLNVKINYNNVFIGKSL